MATIDDFRKLDLRIGRVRAVEPHPRADRLLVLKVDLGSEERQLVAGIRPFYEPSKLLGREVVVVVNLEPVKLRGVESQGMLLATQDPAGVSVIGPDREVAPGSPVT